MILRQMHYWLQYTSITWKGMELNVVDTPGHANFGGEVERVVGMVEGAVLVVDAGEDGQLEFPVLYASAKEGWVSQAYTKCTEGEEQTVAPLMDAIVEHVGDLHAPFRMLVSMMERDVYLGQILTGRDIVSVAGLSQPSIGHTVSAAEVTEALPAAAMDLPTISMTFSVNDSPLAGHEGHQLTGPKIRERLMAEAESNLSIGVLPTAGQDTYEVQGRGELQLGILLENMQYKEENGKKLEPIEEVVIEVNDDHAGLIIEALSHRRAEFLEMGPCPEAVGRTCLSFTCPSRGLLGYQSVFSTDTHGTGFMHQAFLTYGKYRGPLGNVRKGVLVSMASGVITAHALMGLQARGILFVEPGMETYDGMVIGEHSRETDLEVNPVRSKELNNIRTAG
ncbi:unnamed protein product [Sphagnum jensenii]|uniref:Uncharacterized protein n=1 Tax=Sphagnum jensenii TaxID=128206 RepID=A0ABP1AZG0_9BRYO